jgi:glucose/arabinose dehydrogenase
MKLAAITAAVLLATASGRAEAQPQVQPQAQDGPAAAEAQRLLQGAADPGDFADLSSGGLISLKHKPSGLICPFGGDPQGNSLRASPGGLICQSGSASEIDTLQAYHTMPASDADLQDAVGRALGQFSSAQPVSGFADSKSDRPNAPPHVSLRFVFAAPNGDRLFVRVAYAQVGGWFVLQRVVSTPDSAGSADADGERRILLAIGQVMDRQAQAGGK